MFGKPRNFHIELWHILVLNLALAIPTLWVPFYKVDELTNALYARLIINGDVGLKDFLGSTYFLTHYLYVFIFKIIDNSSLMPMHALHGLWKCGTITGLYLAGSQMRDKKTGLWAALFYTVYNFCFMSKDFHTPSAESFSLFPASFVAYFLFRAMKENNLHLYFACGFCVGIATLFKAPMGITLLALNAVFVFKTEKRIQALIAINSAFILSYFSPALFYTNPLEGIKLIIDKLTYTQTGYVAFHQDSFIYWGTKFILRTLLVFASTLGISYLACYAIRLLFTGRRSTHWIHIWFLSLWTLFLWYDATLGKRVFYYYFKFLLVPLPLLAAYCLTTLTEHKKKSFSYTVAHFIKHYIVLFMAIPLVGFSVEGATNFSTRAVIPFDFNPAINYIKEQTKPGDRIYVWGYIPQIYFYSNRLPATSYFWSDVLAGSSPGSPAMEYVRATGDQLSLGEKIAKDLEPYSFTEKESEKIDGRTLSQVSDNELFTVQELLDRIENKHWKTVLNDFFVHPPVLFIDSAPLNYRGFGYYQISKYELLKRFIADNYNYETHASGMPFYRLGKN